MNRKNPVDRFYLKDNRVFDNDIGAIAAGKTNAFINQMQFNLPLKTQTRSRQFKFKAILISTLKKPRPQGPVDFNRHADHLPRHLFPIHLSPALFVSMVCFKIFAIHGTSPQHEPPHDPPKI